MQVHIAIRSEASAAGISDGGCKPIIVEGPSDQHYLTAVKLYLIKAGKIQPARELVFPPAGGAKGVKAVASIVMAKDDTLPLALFDGDSVGIQTIEQLKKTLYAEAQDRLLCVTDFVPLPNAEIEDLFPSEMVVKGVDAVFRAADKPFADVVKAGEAIVPQIEAWAKNENIKLELGWNVDVAKRVKQRLLAGGAVDADAVELWQKLLGIFTA